MDADRPFLSDFLDRHGKRRWRFRRAGKTVSLTGQPGEPGFEAAYEALLAGRPIPPKAKVTQLPNAAPPRSMAAAWRLVTRTVDWQQLSAESQQGQIARAERFLATPIADGETLTYGQMSMLTLERKHIKAILGRFGETPHKAAHILRLLRKLTQVALDEEWIVNDPTYRISFRPPHVGWRAWKPWEREAFERRWAIGTTPRLAYSLALYIGHRRSNVAMARWDELADTGIQFTQPKTGRALWIPIRPELQAVLDATPRVCDTILATQYGKPFSTKSLTGRMGDWTRAAGLEPGCTLHGLRKTLGKDLAESGATTRELMDVLGHRDIAHAELYTREAEQKVLAKRAMRKLRGKAVKLVK